MVERIIKKRAVVGWILYDPANTAFSMGVVSLFLPLWIREQLGAERADVTHTFVVAISMAMIFVVSPLLGAISDVRPRRMPFLVGSTFICVICTALLGRVGLYPTLFFFVVANFAYQAGLQFYDSLILEVTTEKNRGKIGGIGIGIGYLGSFLAVTLAYWPGTSDKPLLFLLIAVSFLLLSIPCFLFVKERGNPNARIVNLRLLKEVTRKTLSTLRGTQEYPGLIRFLIGRAFYTDAMNTVIAIMSLFTMNVAIQSGLTQHQAEAQAPRIYLVAIVFAVLGGIGWGFLVDRFGPKKILQGVLITWMTVLALAAWVAFVALPLWTLYLVGIGAGLCLGGVPSADRPFMALLAPKDRIGEFYGLYGMVSRFAAVIGPALWGLVFYLSVTVGGLKPLVGQGLGILMLLGMMGVGYYILRTVPDRRSR